MAGALLLGLLGLQASAATGQDVPAVRRSLKAYQTPVVDVVGASGRPMRLGRLIDDGRPVVLTFMYSSCNTICPVTNLVLTEFSRLLGPEARQVNVLSISIDPDHDTVTRLADHARATASTSAFFTADPASSEAVQRAFEAWRGDKMNHEAVIFLRGKPGATWVRLDGLVSPKRLLEEFRKLGETG